MKKLLPRVLLSISVLLFSLITLLFANFNQIKPAYAASCLVNPTSRVAGENFNVGGLGFDPATGFHSVSMTGFFPTPENTFNNLALMSYDPATGAWSATVTVPSTAPSGDYIVRVDSTQCYPNLSVTAGGTGDPGGTTSLGTITPPAGIPNPENATNYTAGLIRNGISLLIVIAFVVDLLWTIFAGFRFVTSGGDSKTVGQAWSSIYWGIIGMIVIVGSYAIVKLVETFFQVNILSGGLILP